MLLAGPNVEEGTQYWARILSEKDVMVQKNKIDSRMFDGLFFIVIPDNNPHSK